MGLRLSLFACLLVIGTLVASSALAQKGPEKEPAPFEPVEFAAGEVCPFAIRITSEANKETLKTFPNGREMITGRLTLRVTNLDAPGRSIVVNASGPVTVTPLENDRVRIVQRGRNLLWFFERDVVGPGLLLTTGRVVQVLDLEEDVIVSFQHRGGETDLCAALA
jgi:hypothetical protein